MSTWLSGSYKNLQIFNLTTGDCDTEEPWEKEGGLNP